MKYFFCTFFLFVQLFSNAQSLYINEAMSLNTLTIADEDNDYVDWIEIYNSGNQPVQLQGMGLSNDSLVPLKWTFPNRELLPKSFILVYASGKNRKINNYLHTNFTLNASGTKIFLSDPAGNSIDILRLPYLTPNISFGRKQDASLTTGYCSLPSPGKTNNILNFYNINLETPDFSLPAGYYPDTIRLFLSHATPGVTIHYTTDGSEPNINSPTYIAGNPIILSNRNNDTNVISMIPTNPGLNFPYYTFDSSKANSRGWLPPYGNIKKINVVRAKAFAANAIASDTKTRTYIIDSLEKNRYSFPLVSINTDKEYLFSPDSGIYVYGKPTSNADFDGNYSNTSDDWIIPLYMEYFNTDGTLGLSRYLTAAINGNGGRHAPQKSFRFYRTGQDGIENFYYKFFDDKELSVFEKVLLRNGGHRMDCFPRDNMGDKICDGLNMEVPNYKMVVVFINGEYWGIQSIKERFDNDYFQHNFNIKNEDFTMLQNNIELTEGEPGDELPYQKLIDFVSSNDLSKKENYDYVNTLMDIDNFITFQVSEMYIGNGDWPNNNTRYWRKKTKQFDPEAAYGCDGRWRWVFYDLDGAFGGSCPSFTPTFNSIKRATNTDPLYFKYTQLLRSLLNNTNFKNNFLNRYADLLNSSFSPKVVSSLVIQEKNLIENEMLEHVNRWRYPSVSTTLIDRSTEVPSLIQWNNIISGMLNFASVRPNNDRKRLMDYFLLTDTFKVTLNVSDLAAGEVLLNTITINNKLPGANANAYPWTGTYFKNIPVTLTAIPKPGYKFLNWIGGSNSIQNTITVNLLGNENFTAVFGPDPSFSYSKSILINEINTTNKNIIKDPYDENDDWIELYNPSDYPVDLQGYYLSDDPANLKKYKFPADSKETIIQSKGFMLLWADNQKIQGVLHTPFKLNTLGEQIILTAPDGITLIDSISFSSIGADISLGRYPNGSSNLRLFTQPTPNASNRLESVYNPQILVYNFSVYPNPASGNLVNFSKVTDALVFNAGGQLVLQVKAVDSIDISKLPGGIYYLRTPEGQTAKLVKI